MIFDYLLVLSPLLRRNLYHEKTGYTSAKHSNKLDALPRFVLYQTIDF